jgi:hypothetical protein
MMTHLKYCCRSFHYPVKALVTLLIVFSVSLLTSQVTTSQAIGADWSIPFAGNVFRVADGEGDERMRLRDGLRWGSVDDVFAIHFHLDRPATVRLALSASVADGASKIGVRCAGESWTVGLTGDSKSRHDVGTVTIAKPGYVRVEIRGVEKTGDYFAQLHDLIVASDTPGVTVDYVRDNEGNMFYWGRRGPSVHLGYVVPKDKKLRFSHTEVTVPAGQDAIGSFFMANGFSEGYFGMQVNGPDERRVLFSVWSPYSTDDPAKIPADQRVVTLAKGPDVRVGEFGNEGSGGQSILVYPWKAGVTYRFLTEVVPDGEGNTTYTAWFAEKTEDKSGAWRLIASFKRPKTDTTLRGFHSFLESFEPATGHIGRLGNYGNVWVRDVDGEWHACAKAKFGIDATGSGRHRLDYAGGARGDHFFLRNCGFFDSDVKEDATFVRDVSTEESPQIDIASLPRG